MRVVNVFFLGDCSDISEVLVLIRDRLRLGLAIDIVCEPLYFPGFYLLLKKKRPSPCFFCVLHVLGLIGRYKMYQIQYCLGINYCSREEA